MTAAELHRHLAVLAAERAAASLEGLDRDDAYMRGLRADIDATRAGLVGAAVTEIASLRAALSGRQLG